MICWLHTEMFAYIEIKTGCCIMLLLVVIMSIRLFVITGCNESGKAKVIHKVLSMGYNFTLIRKNSNEFKERAMICWLPILMFESKGLSWDVVHMVVLNIFFHYVYP